MHPCPAVQEVPPHLSTRGETTALGGVFTGAGREMHIAFTLYRAGGKYNPNLQKETESSM